MTDPSPASLPPSPYSTLTKRTFHTAIAELDSSFKSASPYAVGGQGASKRRAVPTSTPALQSLLAASHPTPLPPTTAPPSYTPTSLPSLLSRLQTYRLTTFSPKPPSLSPPSCASYGWINRAPPRDRIECVSCGSGIILLAPDGGWETEGGKKMAGKLVDALRDKHEPSWDAVKALKEGLKGVEMNVKSPLGEEDVARVLSAVGNGGGLSPSEVLLTVFGWALVPAEGEGVVGCEMCDRKVLVESYAVGGKEFDVEKQHHSWCCFVASVGGEEGAAKGWEGRVASLVGGRRKSSGLDGGKDLAPNEAAEFVRSVLGPRRSSGIGR
ncbi:zinc finger, C3HC-like protein [Pseudohyphozyma bogoriensis]|nr:zinc finger, C3HC-like protein [Pseudohyphozyma bogoriensis]